MIDDTSTKILRERILFVYAMNGKVKCYSLDETEPTTIEEGWEHTATIDPARWIEALASGDRAADMINEIRGTGTHCQACGKPIELKDCVWCPACGNEWRTEATTTPTP